jgi:uncharacterized membrane protein
MSNQYPPPGTPPTGYDAPYGTPQMNAPLSTPPAGGGTRPGGKTSLGLDSNVAGMLSYLANILCCLGVILSIVFLITEKESRLVRFHAAQSLLLIGVAIVTSIVLTIFTTLLNLADIPLLSFFVGLGLRGIVLLIFLAIWVIAGLKAYQGIIYKLPVIGDLAEKMTGQ